MCMVFCSDHEIKHGQFCVTNVTHSLLPSVSNQEVDGLLITDLDIVILFLYDILLIVLTILFQLLLFLSDWR